MYRRITLTTDFSNESQIAFHHALALALRFKSTLDILHVRNKGEDADWPHFPHVRETLARWGKIAANANPSDVGPQLGIALNKIDVASDRAIRTIADFAQTKGTDLLVAASHGRTGLNLWLQGSMAADIALTARLPALLVGPKAKPFVSAQTGNIDLSHVVFPVAQKPSPHGAFEELVQILDGAHANVNLLHVKEGPSRYDTGEYQRLPVTLRNGEAVAVILEEATRQNADLLLMATEGQHGLMDALRGSTTARVLHDAPCPLLAVPTLAIA
jgi:nucleotide-binding universal stress UspA family protein